MSEKTDKPEQEIEQEKKPVEKAEARIDKETRLPEGIVLTAVYHFLMALPDLLIGFILLTIPIPVVIMSVEDPVGLTAALVALGLLSLGFGLMGVLYVLAGIGLLKRWNWARWLAIALGMLWALVIPIGTILGATVIIYLLSEDVTKLYQR